MVRALLVLGMVAVLGAARPTAAQTVLFVNGGQATGANSGASWGDAFRGAGALQRALDAAGSPLAGAPMVEIWVARGTYVPTARTDPEEPRSVTFRLRSRVQLYGGFVGTETLRPQRRPWDHPTVLSGLLETGERAWHVVTTGGVDASCVLDGFVVRDGRAEIHEPGTRARGAGIYNVGGSPVVRNCSIVDNVAGGFDRDGAGVYTQEGSPRFMACRFKNNHGGRGAGLSGSATLIDCVFEGNVSPSLDGLAGAVFGDCVIRRCVFRGNYSDFGAGAVHGAGTIEDSLFEANPGGHGSGALIGTYTVARTTFRNHRDSHGPTAAAASFTECDFISNWADYGVVASGDTLVRCRFRGNGLHAATIRERAESCVFTGGITRVNGGASVVNCTFLESGRVIREFYTSTEPVTITNCVFWSSWNFAAGQAAHLDPSLAPLVINYSCVKGWDGSLGGVGNFGADPMLDPEGRPLPLSPCIDAGDGDALSAGAATDLLGQPRRVDDAGMPNRGVGLPPVDIGAVEFQGTSCYPNCDGSAVPPVLNVADLTCFLERFAQGHPYANCDGSASSPALNIADFVCFLQRFQEGCE